MVTMTTPDLRAAVGATVSAYLAELDAEGIPLHAEVTIAAVLADVLRLAGLPVPAAALAAALVGEVTP